MLRLLQYFRKRYCKLWRSRTSWYLQRLSVENRRKQFSRVRMETLACISTFILCAHLQFAFGLPKSSWQESSFQREFLEDVYKELNLKTWQDWYSVNASELVRLGGSELLHLHNRSISLCVSRNFPGRKMTSEL